MRHSQPAVLHLSRQSHQVSKMISDQQLEANRANALLSTGPKTEEGRKRSRTNALRHGLTGQVNTMTDEDRVAHDKFSDALIENLAPEGAMETQLAQRVATDSWRLNRASAIEDNLFALGLYENDDEAGDALNTARVFTAEAKQLQLLTLYEQRLNRSVQKNLALLQSLQAARKAQREITMKEAANLLRLCEMKGLEYQPANDGFVFSTDEIHDAIDRNQRLTRAATMDFSKYKARKFQARAA
jgi:hypothetical protein